jgi:NADPH:quinone reductase-like Zn-dependent oxidoreductase
MKAAVRSTYGNADVLRITDVDKPVPAAKELLIKVFATTVNRTDCGILGGKPFLLRLFAGLSKPKLSITGTDFAGEVQAIGGAVQSFKVGDKVMGFAGMGLQSHAEYLCIDENKAVLTIPENLSYPEAAACMEGSFYAASGVNLLKPKEGQKALVLGATGAIGSATVQFLKFYGVNVTATCRAEHRAIVQSLGADRTIDYQNEDFTKDREQYDFVFDAVGKSSFAVCKPLLKNAGIYSSNDGFENLFLALSTKLFGRKKVVFSIPKDLKGGLAFVRDLAATGKFRPLIDRTYPFHQITDAFNYVATGQKTGNVILQIGA